MLAEVRGTGGDRKRKRPVIQSEAYPESEYNLPPTSAGELQIHRALTQQSFKVPSHIAPHKIFLPNALTH